MLEASIAAWRRQEGLVNGRVDRDAFMAAIDGWVGDVAYAGEASAHARAAAILSVFAGLHVGTNGAGQDKGRSEVHFFLELMPEEDEQVEDWVAQCGELAAIAFAAQEYLTIVVDGPGNFYLYVMVTGDLFPMGRHLRDLVRPLLYGTHYGPPLERASQAPSGDDQLA